MELEVGKIVSGKISSITKFGAFLTFENGKTGLIHISEISRAYVSDINEFLKIGDEVEAYVISVDPAGKIGLSIKKLETERQNAQISNNAPVLYAAKETARDMSFEDKLKSFKSASDEKFMNLKKNKDFQTKRTGKKTR